MGSGNDQIKCRLSSLCSRENNSYQIITCGEMLKVEIRPLLDPCKWFLLLYKLMIFLLNNTKSKPVKITFGFSQNKNHYGIMMYNRNRLIKPYVRVGYQLKVSLCTIFGLLLMQSFCCLFIYEYKVLLNNYRFTSWFLDFYWFSGSLSAASQFQ